LSNDSIKPTVSEAVDGPAAPNDGCCGAAWRETRGIGVAGQFAQSDVTVETRKSWRLFRLA